MENRTSVYQLFPRDLIRACVSILYVADDAVSNFVTGDDEDNFEHTSVLNIATKLLEDHDNPWPLLVRNHSQLYKQLSDLVQAARNNAAYWVKMDEGNNEVVQTYIMVDEQKFQCISDDLTIDESGLVTNHEVIGFQEPKTWRTYETPTFNDLESERSKDRFQQLLMGWANFKGRHHVRVHGGLPKDLAGVGFRRLLSNAIFADPGVKLNTAGVPSEPVFKPSHINGVHDTKRTELGEGTADLHTAVSKDTTIFTPKESRTSSPPLIECGIIDNAKRGHGGDPSEIRLTYAATLETANDSFTMNINPQRIEGQDVWVVQWAKEIWTRRAAKGRGDKDSLEALVGLVQDVYEDSEDD